MSTERRVHVDAKTGYDLWAPTYDSTPNPIVAVDDTVLGELIGDVSGLVIIDAGCGTGRHTATLAKRAARVIAIDYSHAMLDQVRAKVGDNVELIEHDLGAPLPLPGACANGVICALVGEHLCDLHACFRELARVLAPGGWLVFSAYHPFLALAGKEANFTDRRTGVEYRLGAVRHLVSDYFAAMRSAGFTVDVLREYLADEHLLARLPALERYRGTPLLLAMRATVAPAGAQPSLR